MLGDDISNGNIIEGTWYFLFGSDSVGDVLETTFYALGPSAELYQGALAITSMFSGSIRAFNTLSRASEFGIATYKNLRTMIAGSGLFAHHIIEQRFLPALKNLGLKAGNMLSVAVTAAEHQVFTNAWRSYFGYGTNYTNITVQEIWDAAQKIYADYPALLEAARQTLGM